MFERFEGSDSRIPDLGRSAQKTDVLQAGMTNARPIARSRGRRRALFAAAMFIGVYAVLWIWCQVIGSFFILRYQGYYSFQDEGKVAGEYVPRPFFLHKHSTTTLIPMVLNFRSKIPSGTLIVYDSSHPGIDPTDAVSIRINYLVLIPENGNELVLVDESTEPAMRSFLRSEIPLNPRNQFDSDFVRQASYELDPALLGEDITVIMNGTSIFPDGKSKPFYVSKTWYFGKGTKIDIDRKYWLP